jgi:hypothetical protein
VNSALVMAGALLFPLLGLGLLLWLTHLEETLPRAVDRTRRRPDPPPILAIPVREPQPATVRIPRQRVSAQTVAASLPEPSLGGSTNR